ncbi:two-component sensor histidine kinase [Exilibacterium tricleocarpae]|uniref:histidine kinase n=2 Tax=Exilibacterium tricleocarpae TaxID=2591008 RepID=A0A545STM0_9GAMM|nr:two-component sensor histidine kinase [Exilibacterium tricleocarpae]
MLDAAFHRSLYAAEAERLKTHIYLLLGAAEVEAGELWFPEQLTEPRFSQLGSGLYGWVGNAERKTLWRSDSAQLMLPPDTAVGNAPVRVGAEHFYATELNGKALFAYYYDVSWDIDEGSRVFRFATLHAQDRLQAELTEYRAQLWRWLGALVVLLLITQALILRWGLRPLRQLAEDLTAVESGETEQLRGQYPSEIQPVTDNLNLVLRNEQAQRERYRNTLADLAHSLKTPLAVIRGSVTASRGQSPDPTLNEQIDRMDQIVSHQLQRATLNSRTLVARATAVAPVVQRLSQALDKVYSAKGIVFEAGIEEDIAFHGDERDLMEALGNLIENAYKYGRSRVRCSASRRDGQLHLCIEDDGAGVPEANRQTILQRGARADTATPGQGIGLAVAVDIISSYNGSIRIGKSSLGGASFNLILPGFER